MSIANINKLFYLILSLSLFLGLYFGEDSAGSGGFRLDFSTTWPLVENPFRSDLTIYDIKFPLHYYIASAAYFVLNDKNYLRFFYCLIALLSQYIFYACLKKKFIETDKNNLFFFSLIVLMLPSVRSAAIWPNTQITAILFFLISTYFFLTWESKKNYNNFSKDLFFTILFMSLTVYTRQIYAMIFLYLIAVYYKKLAKKVFIQSLLLTFLFAIPGIFFIIFWPAIIKATFVFEPYNSLLVNASIISLYLIPFFLIINFFNEKIITPNLKNLIITGLISVIILCSSLVFDYNFKMGGGFFIKLSMIFFDNLILFYITSIMGFYLLYILCNNYLLNYILTFLILIVVSGYIVFQKYYEPMFIFLLFFYYKTDLTNKFLSKKSNIYMFNAFFLLYFLSALSNDFLKLTKSL
jgi:hypothetical protein